MIRFMLVLATLISTTARSAEAQRHPGSSIFKKHVFCTFAPKATLWDGKHWWNARQSIAENMVHIKKDLDAYVEHVRLAQEKGEAPIDGFPIEAPASLYGTDLATFAEWVRQVLYEINPVSIEGLATLEPDNDDVYWEDGWQFTYRDLRLFVVTTAPIYPITNSRYSGGAEQKHVVMHLQPEYSFKYRFSHLPPGVTKEFRKQNIRKRFAEHGRDYYLDFAPIMGAELGRKTHEAPRYVKPLHAGDATVKWWLPNDEVDLDACRENICSRLRDYCSRFSMDIRRQFKAAVIPR